MQPIDSDDENDNVAAFAPRERWKSDAPLPEVEVVTSNRKTGQARSPEAIENERHRLAMAAQREERSRIAKALPQSATKGPGVKGGAHDQYAAWSAEEDEALLRILPLNKERPSWAEVTQALTATTKVSRTSRSVRCHWNRMRTNLLNSTLPEGHKQKPRYRCRICGMTKRGHVCSGISAQSKKGEEMLAEVHKALVAKGLVAASSDEDDDGARAA